MPDRFRKFYQYRYYYRYQRERERIGETKTTLLIYRILYICSRIITKYFLNFRFYFLTFTYQNIREQFVIILTIIIIYKLRYLITFGKIFTFNFHSKYHFITRKKLIIKLLKTDKNILGLPFRIIYLY